MPHKVGHSRLSVCNNQLDRCTVVDYEFVTSILTMHDAVEISFL